jgi:uncharacterized protein YegL
MAGEPIETVSTGLHEFCVDLKNCPQCIEVAWLSVIALSSDAKLLTPLTELMDFSPPELPIGLGRSLGAALELLSDRIAQEVRPMTRDEIGDFHPFVVLVTSGPFTDNWHEPLARFKATNKRYKLRDRDITAIGFGSGADVSMLREIAPQVFIASDPRAALKIEIAHIEGGFGERFKVKGGAIVDETIYDFSVWREDWAP